MNAALLIALALIASQLLNRYIDREAPPEKRIQPRPLQLLTGGKGWEGAAVLALSVAMALRLGQLYGMGSKFALFYAATLLLIVVGTVDWRIRMIDTLLLVVGTVVLLVLSGFGVGIAMAMLGTIAAGIVFLLLYIIARILYPSHAAPFGLGDVYLGIFIGALLGLFHMPRALFYGILMAGLVSVGIILVRAAGKKTPVYISYGTYLCLGVLLYLAIWPV